MTIRVIIYFGLSLISVVVALIIFFRGLDIKALLFLIFGVAAVLLFRLGIAEIQKKQGPHS
jgi:membrane protein implicated in regulation of membrane protease activity